MPSFSRRSQERLDSCHPDLKTLFNLVVGHMDCTVLKGHRGKEEQNAAYDDGKSTLRFPKSRHNKIPALAVDVVPYPIDWYDHKRFDDFALFVKGVALGLDIAVTWGGDWKTLVDKPHWELR